ncbi:MAG: type IV pilin N-terminal domain-containing protein [Candidatus Heimdallarchaeota archaeon]|nr:type IV pilin N-terminal domain-containing protein [Candidatus Heimdallarchaeota archaeon]
MFELLKKYKKGVSPVIAVVLLIALTVAAAAVIWTIVQDTADIDTSIVSVTVNSAQNTTNTNLQIVMTLDSNVDATINSIVFTDGPDGAIPTLYATTFLPLEMIKGDTIVTFNLDLAAGWTLGDYEFSISYTPEGESARTTTGSFTLTA